MKTIIIISFLFCSTISFAQVKIIFNNSNSIDANLVSIKNGIISYKIIDTINRPIFHSRIDIIKTIKLNSNDSILISNKINYHKIKEYIKKDSIKLIEIINQKVLYDTIVLSKQTEIVCTITEINNEDILFQRKGFKNINNTNKSNVISIKYANGDKSYFKDILTNQSYAFPMRIKQNESYSINEKHIKIIYKKERFIISNIDSITQKVYSKFISIDEVEEYLKHNQNSFQLFTNAKKNKPNKIKFWSGMIAGFPSAAISGGLIWSVANTFILLTPLIPISCWAVVFHYNYKNQKSKKDFEKAVEIFNNSKTSLQ